MCRLDRYNKVLFTGEPGASLTQFVREDGVFLPSTGDIGISERPPMAQVAAYRRWMASTGAPAAGWAASDELAGEPV